MSSLNVAQEAHLHRAFGAVGDIPQNVRQQASSRMACSVGEELAQGPVGDQTAEEGPAKEGQSVVVGPFIGQVDHGVACRHPPGPVQLVDVSVRIDPAMDHYTARGRYPAMLVDVELDGSRRLAEQTVDEARGST
jgi:hypothetical protein